MYEAWAGAKEHPGGQGGPWTGTWVEALEVLPWGGRSSMDDRTWKGGEAHAEAGLWSIKWVVLFWCRRELWQWPLTKGGGQEPGYPATLKKLTWWVRSGHTQGGVGQFRARWDGGIKFRTFWISPQRLLVGLAGCWGAGGPEGLHHFWVDANPQVSGMQPEGLHYYGWHAT